MGKKYSEMPSVADLEKQCEEQGEKVKTLKGSGAGPDAVKAEVAQLLVLKGTLIELLEKEIAGSPANKAELEAKLLKARPLTKGKDKKKETKVAAPTEQTAEQKAKAAAKAADKDAKKAARQQDTCSSCCFCRKGHQGLHCRQLSRGERCSSCCSSVQGGSSRSATTSFQRRTAYWLRSN